MGRVRIESRSREGREQRSVERYMVRVDLDTGGRVLFAMTDTDEGIGERREE